MGGAFRATGIDLLATSLLLLRPAAGHCEFEDGTLTGLRLDPDISAAAFDELFADRQTDSVARILSSGMQTMEDYKNVLRLLPFYADPVIGHAK